MDQRRGILTEKQRQAVQAEYKNLTYHPNKMKSDIEEQIESFSEDLQILKQYDEALYEQVLEAVEMAEER